jgi:O-antigen ligase
MFEKRPLTGQGFLAYKQLADEFGDPVLGSPHNEWLRLFAEEGIIGGIVGLCFAATTLSWLSHGRGALATGILAGTAGYFTMASFNNPLLFISVSAVVYPLIGYAIVFIWRDRHPHAVDPETALLADDRNGGAASELALRPT